MHSTFVIVGRIAREFILPSAGQPSLDHPGGPLLYAAGGLMVWEKEIGLLTRVGEDYPRTWLKDLVARGMDIQGVRILPQSMDLRSFIAYDEKFSVTHSNPVLQFARRELPFRRVCLDIRVRPKSRTTRRSLIRLRRCPLKFRAIIWMQERFIFVRSIS